MSKMRFTKIAAACIALLLLLSATACGGSSNNSSQTQATTAAATTASTTAAAETTTTASTTAESTSGATQSASKYDWGARDKITIKLTMLGSPINEEWGVLNDPVTKMLNERFNIEIFAINGGDSPEFNTLLAAMVASGDTPDIMQINETSMRKQMIEAKQVLEMSSYMTPELMPQQCSDNLAKAAIKMQQISSGFGDKVYWIPAAKGTWDSGQGPTASDYIRWDLYKELGYPPVETKVDLLNLLKTMQDTFPESYEGKKAYGTGWAFGDSWASWPMSCLAVFGSNMTPLGSYPYILAIDKNTQDILPENQLYDENGAFWPIVWFYNQAWQMGILDPESFIQGMDALNDKLNQGIYYHQIVGWMPSEYQAEYDKAGHPEIGFTWLPAVEYDTQGLQTMNVLGERANWVSASTKEPDRVMALLDYLSTYEFSRIGRNGLEGIYWEMVDGIPTPKPERYNGTVEDDEMKKISGLGVYGHIAGYARGAVDPANGMPISLAYAPVALKSTMSIVKQDQLALYGGDSLFEAYTKKLKNYKSVNVYSMPPVPEGLYDAENLNDYVTKNIYKIIRADSNEEYKKLRDAFISDLAQFNVDEAFKWMYDAIKDQKEQAKEILDLYNMK